MLLGVFANLEIHASIGFQEHGRFLGQGAILMAVGLFLGVWGAVAVGHILQSQLYGVRSGDPWVLGLTAVVFGVCGLMAIGWPALRAASVDQNGLRDRKLDGGLQRIVDPDIDSETAMQTIQRVLESDSIDGATKRGIE